ncbi:hypothetical protein [Streptomyces sp. NPDC047829]|uniref:hypothetical protein n=1 Tax=Streptomyces sp. NPDC047829 TaxID=3154609 RepID=UPI003411A3B6
MFTTREGVIGSRRRWRMSALLTAVLLTCTAWQPATGDSSESSAPRPPRPERIAVERLPLPPTSPSRDEGACTKAVNPLGTGCMGSDWNAVQGGGFTTDGRHVMALVQFTGAPAAPDPASVYQGRQLILIRVDGSTFPNGDPWKCVTCGSGTRDGQYPGAGWEHPEAFADGKRVMMGATVISCGRHHIVSQACTPDDIRAHPIRWNVRADGTGETGSMRELRLHPDGRHIGFSSVAMTGNRFDQYSYLARLEFNPAPKTGSPRVPRYDLHAVTRLFDTAGNAQPVQAEERSGSPGRLVIRPGVPSVGELRGFSADGREVTYIGYPSESSNIDVYAADLRTGKVRRLTAHPEYTDPVTLSPDNRWTAALDTRGSDRQMFLAGMRGVPPLTDLLTTSAVSSVRNNGQRRFFQPYLIDRYGDRGNYFGQQINEGDTGPGGIGDPNWNAGADPVWSPDGTAIAYWQRLVSAPSCGDSNPVPCPTSTEPGERRTRMMVAKLTERDPVRSPKVSVAPHRVPWGTPYEPEDRAPLRPYPPAGEYVLRGEQAGTAHVRISWNEEGTNVRTVKVSYENYSDGARRILNGTEQVTRESPSPTVSVLTWHSDLVQTTPSGRVLATKRSSPDGMVLTVDLFKTMFEATGTLTTTVGDRTYTQPANGT